jgi:hypothetical protein
LSATATDALQLLLKGVVMLIVTGAVGLVFLLAAATWTRGRDGTG